MPARNGNHLQWAGHCEICPVSGGGGGRAARAAAVKAFDSNRDLSQRMVMRAPDCGGNLLLVTTVAPERSSSVLAIKRPRPRPESSSCFICRSARVVT